MAHCIPRLRAAHPQKDRFASGAFGRCLLPLVRVASRAYLKRTMWRLGVCRYPQPLGPSNLFGVQRLFSEFPRGWPGIGLLLLRLSVTTACLQACVGCEACTAWILLGLIILCASLCLGALTPLAAALAVPVGLIAAANCINGAGLVVITEIDAVALAVLGPGAYSLDARLFGRRVILAESWRDVDCE